MKVAYVREVWMVSELAGGAEIGGLAVFAVGVVFGVKMFWVVSHSEMRLAVSFHNPAFFEKVQ